MQCDVNVIYFFISNKVEYLDRDTVAKRDLQVIFAMQSSQYWTKVCVKGTLKSDLMLWRTR